MAKLKKQNYLQILFVLSILILSFAFIIEHIFDYQPCNLCVIERIPYLIAIIVLILNYNFKKNEVFFSVLLMIVFAFSILISIYHFGIEQGLIEESAVCGNKDLNLINKEDILNSLQILTVNCKDVAFKIFDLSLTTYNIIISIFMFLLSAKIYLFNNDIKK